MSTKNLARDVESIALALSEEGGYEYYHIDDELRELAKDVQDMQAENARLREQVEDMHAALQAFCDAQDVHGDNCPLWVERTDDCELRGIEHHMRELGIEAG